MNSISRKSLGHYLVIPVLLLLIVVILVPEIWSFALSLTRYEPGGNIEYRGLLNYINIFLDSSFWNAVKNNIIFVIVVVSLQLLLALGFALLLARGFKGQKIWVSCVILPYALSPVVTVSIWKYMLNYDIGIINFILDKIGFAPIPWLSNSLWAFIAVIIVYTWKQVPFTFIIVYPARLSISRELYEAAAIDGANEWQHFRFITFPILKPTILVAMTFRLILAFRAFGEIWLLTGGGPIKSTEVLAIYMYKEGFKYWHWGISAAVGVLILLLTMMMSYPQMRIMYRQMFQNE